MKKKSLALLTLGLITTLGCGDGQETNNPVDSTTNDTPKYNYETVDNDPLGVKIYTLENGLKVYMSVNKDAPRIQTYIATRAGSKNDPSDATGLAHYLEHMLFKGSSRIGALEWEKEKVMLQEISDLYEEHRNAAPEDRKAIYAKIDSVSQDAAKLVAANEYDKMISSLGAKGTNAFTSLDRTVYVNDIPSNEFEKWLKVESERFNELVLRLFHTELEAVYEEYNISQSSDQRKVFTAFMEGLLPNHPYGTQTTIGTGEHLKTPSMVKIHEYFNTYYVPNNMAIILAGDFEPDEVVTKIESYFGDYQSKDVPEWKIEEQPPITEPIVREVKGQEKAVVDIGWRLPGAGSREAMLAEMASNILTNGKAGLIDINLVQKQVVGRETSAFAWSANDFTFFGLYGAPRTGQSLEAVRDSLIGQLDLLRKGEFEDWMLEAVVNNLEYRSIKQYESNRGRVSAMLDAFIFEEEWSKTVSYYEDMRKITKQEVVDFVNKNFTNDNYVIVYKREAKDDPYTVEKPAITPISVNRDTFSDFRNEFDKIESPRNKPVFVNYKESIKNSKLASGVNFDYINNKENATFSLSYIVDMGSNHDPVLPIAVKYLPYLGTDKYTPEQLQQEFFKLGVSFNVYSSSDVSYITLSGLERSLEQGIELFEHILANIQPDEAVLQNLIADIKKEREDAKKNKRNILYQGMMSYGKYGAQSPLTSRLSNTDLDALTAVQLTEKLKTLTSYEHTIFYYGEKTDGEVKGLLDKYHTVPAELMPIPEERQFIEQETNKDKVVFVHFDGMPQAEILMLSKGTNGFSLDEYIMSQLYNDYFGAGLSSIVFQEIRESKALAYSAYAFNSSPSRQEDAHYVRAFVGTQTDKMSQAIPAMMGIIDTMPIAEDLIANAMDAILKKIESERITKTSIYWNYRSTQKRGYDRDLREDVYNKFSNVNAENNQLLEEFQSFQQQKISGRDYTYLVLGDKNLIDKDYLKTVGEYEEVSIDQLFGE